jgi:hypothetical protein
MQKCRRRTKDDVSERATRRQDKPARVPLGKLAARGRAEFGI